MSKAQLKKELATMDADQLRELILDVYSAKKEAKEYFEFFLNPDVKKLTDKVALAIYKEINRSKHGTLVARFSVILNMIKEYESFGVDAEQVLRMMLTTLSLAVELERIYYSRPTFANGTVKLMFKTLEFADRHGYFDKAIVHVDNAIQVASSNLSLQMREVLANYKVKLK